MHDELLTLSSFFEAWPLFRESALSGALAGALLGVLGVYVVLRRLVFLTAAVGQAAGLGVTLSFYLQGVFGLTGVLASPTIGAAVLTLLAVVLVLRAGADGHSTGRNSTRQDSMLGVIWLVGSAGTLSLGTRIVQEMHDVQTLLFGTAVAVVPEDYTLLLWLTATLLLVHLVGWRGFSAVSFDPQGARIRGLPVRALEWVLFISLALAVSTCTGILGALPTFAFSVLPALGALALMSMAGVGNVQRALVIAGVLGAGCGFGGYVLAYLYELPVGASQTLLGGVVVVSLWLLGLGVQLGRRWWGRSRASVA
ncbi:MAG: metal ABC transporter permease [Bradymonadia bacterium]